MPIFTISQTLLQGLQQPFILLTAPHREAEEALIQPPEIAGVPNHDAVGQHLLPQGGRGHPRPGEFHQEIIHHAGKRGQPRQRRQPVQEEFPLPFDQGPGPADVLASRPGRPPP